MSGDDVAGGDQVGEGEGDDASTPPKQIEYRTGGLTVRLPAEPPTLTPRAARALLEIIHQLGDLERERRRQGDPK